MKEKPAKYSAILDTARTVILRQNSYAGSNSDWTGVPPSAVTWYASTTIGVMRCVICGRFKSPDTLPTCARCVKVT